MKESLWSNSVKLPEFESLKKNIKTDVLIIGGGICGLLCAYYLKQAGIDCALVEGSTIASGITKNTTAKITSLHGLIYARLTDTIGQEQAQMYLTANKMAIQAYQALAQNIDCDFEEKDAYTYSLSDRSKMEAEVRAVKQLGFDADFLEETELPFPIKGAIRFKHQAQFHPLKLIAELAKKLPIYEHTFVSELTPYGAKTQLGSIRAKKIIVATHFPFLNKHGSYFLKLYQHRSYVSALDHVTNINGMYVDEDKKGLSFRTYGNLLLLGGSGHRTGKPSGAWETLNDVTKKYYPKAQVRYQWATQDTMSLDGIPYIGQYSKRTPNLYVATGFNKWGMTSAMVSAMILSETLQGKQVDFAEVFSPQRSMLKPQLLINGLEATANLLTPTSKRCPHLGCALKWNRAEHSWDCPCHGSRFQKDGKLIDNPATGDAKL